MCPSPASPYVSSHSLLQGKADLVLIKFCSKVALSPLLCIAWMAPRCGIIDANNVTIIAHKFPFFKVLKDGAPTAEVKIFIHRSLVNKKSFLIHIDKSHQLTSGCFGILDKEI